MRVPNCSRKEQSDLHWWHKACWLTEFLNYLQGHICYFISCNTLFAVDPRRIYQQQLCTIFLWPTQLSGSMVLWLYHVVYVEISSKSSSFYQTIGAKFPQHMCKIDIYDCIGIIIIIRNTWLFDRVYMINISVVLFSRIFL